MFFWNLSHAALVRDLHSHVSSRGSFANMDLVVLVEDHAFPPNVYIWGDEVDMKHFALLNAVTYVRRPIHTAGDMKTPSG